MNDREIIERITDFYLSTSRTDAESLLDDLRSIGLDVTEIAAMDQVYVFRMSSYARDAVLRALAADGEKDYWDEVYALTPEER